MLIFDQLKRNDIHLRTLTWGVIIGMVILLAGLWYVQVIYSRHFVADQRAQSFRTVRIPAIRGRILDRNGIALAENQPSYNISLYIDELREQFKAAWRTNRPSHRVSRQERLALEAETRYEVASNVVQRLSEALQQPVVLDRGDFLNHYTNQLALPLPVLVDLNPAQIARFQEQPFNPVGLDLDVQPQRFYPYHQTAAHILGYLVRDNRSMKGEDAFFNYRLPDYRGVVGIEGMFDSELRGKAGVKSVLVNSLGYRQSENIWAAAEPGRNLVLTIDLPIQQAAEKALHALGSDTRGAVVVLNPDSGDVLAMVSSPAFDPNMFIPRISHEDYAKLSDPILRPQINRAIQENYAPGSIFKIVVGLACLDAGMPPDATIHNPGYIFVGRRKIGDLAPPGEYDFRRAFLKSSNTYFITNGLKLGVEGIVRIGEQLHLGERTGIPTGQEVSGYFPDLDTVKRGWFDGDTANLCIGQGRLDVTPLQMSILVAAIANGGKVLAPRLVARLEEQDPNSEEPKTIFPNGVVRNRLPVQAHTLQIIRNAMLADVEDSEGTGKAAAVPEMRVCGKTGTAQVTDNHNRVVDHTTWFASFAPYEDPRYAVVVMVESGASGGGTCAPIAHKIYTEIVRQEKLRATGNPAVAQVK